MESSEFQRPRRPVLAGGELLAEDLERVGGGGAPYHPQSFERTVALLTPQIEALRSATSDLPIEMRGERIVFEAKVLPNYLANSHFPKELFAEANLVPVGTRGSVGDYRTRTRDPESRSTKTYLVAGNERSIETVDELLHGEVPNRPAARKAREFLRQFDLIRLPPSEETVRVPAELSEEQITFEAVIHPSINAQGRLSEDEWRSVLGKWRDLVRSLGGELAEDYIRTIKDLTFTPVRLPRDAVDAVGEFNPLRAIRPMPSVRPAPGGPFRVVATAEPGPEPPPDDAPRSSTRVAVFDGGVDDQIASLAPFVRYTDLTGQPANADAVAHGTLVTSTLLYGTIDGAAPLLTPDVSVDHFRVFPVPPGQMDLDLYWILDRISEQVVGGTHRIINLSLGPDHCVDDDEEPHAWTARLDELAEQHDVLFISAVGNNGELDSAIGADRVQAPADMVNGIGVGACTAAPPSSPWARAPYSAVGPGRPGCRVQPIGVAFGGVDGQALRGLIPGNVIGEACGTSFAAPTAAHALSSLAAAIGSVGEDPQVLRAFAVHFAEAPDPAAYEQVGYGRLPARFDGLLECGPNQAIVVYRDTINRGQALALPFPVPEPEVRGRMVRLRWTIAFAAPTDPKDPVDYTQAGLEVAFRPHAETRDFRHPDTGESKTVNVRTHSSTATRLLRDGFDLSALPKARPAERARHETERRRDEGKWETIMSFGARKRARSLMRPQATLVYLAREEGSLASAPPLEFTMILSIEAPRDVELYDAVRSRYQVLSPLRTKLPLRLQT